MSDNKGLWALGNVKRSLSSFHSLGKQTGLEVHLKVECWFTPHLLHCANCKSIRCASCAGRLGAVEYNSRGEDVCALSTPRARMTPMLWVISYTHPSDNTRRNMTRVKLSHNLRINYTVMYWYFHLCVPQVHDKQSFPGLDRTSGNNNNI